MQIEQNNLIKAYVDITFTFQLFIKVYSCFLIIK